MKNVIFLIILFSIVIANTQVDTYKVIGNQHTQSKIILREIYHPIPARFDSLLAKEDRDRIYNLGLFSSVNISRVDTVYTIFVVETFRFMPIPIVEYEEGIGFSVGAGLAFFNFRGLNEKLVFGGIRGNQSTYFFNFSDPWVFGDHASIDLETYQYYSESAVYDYGYLENKLGVALGFYNGEYQKYKFEIAYEKIKLESISNQPEGYNFFHVDIDNPFYTYLASEISYQFDTRDIYTDPTKGNRLQLKLFPKWGLDSTAHRIELAVTNTKYTSINFFPLGPVLSFKTQLILQNSKDLPKFNQVFLGGENLVRGYSPIVQKNPKAVKDKMQGNQIFYQNMQLQHTLMNRRDYNGMELGIDAKYFIDYGIGSQSMLGFSLKNGILGYGIGLKLFISGAGTISLDLGFNPYGSRFIHPSD